MIHIGKRRFIVSKRKLESIPVLLLAVVWCGLAVPRLVMGQAQETKLRVIAFGAHPDDCDGKFGGTAAKFAQAGHAVKFVSVTNGDAGHQSEARRWPNAGMRRPRSQPAGWGSPNTRCWTTTTAS
jgi:hypothetical protein